MIRVLLVAAVLATMALATAASAAEARNARTEVAGTRRGPVAKLVELERRKNEWLRQRFGR